MTTVKVESPVRPSEDEDKVRMAMLNLFPDLRLRREGASLLGTGASLVKFGQLLKRYRIRDAARGVMLKGMHDDGMTVFRLNKQAAFMEKVGFAGSESPLGELTVQIESGNLQAVIDELAPDTRPLSMRLADGKGHHGKGGQPREKVHIREKLDPKELLDEDVLEEL